MTIEDKVKSLVRDVRDFPKPGIIFKDISPLLASPSVRREVVDAIVQHFRPLRPDAIAAVEARGFIFGMLLAEGLDVPFVPVRKAGKLPYKKIRQAYALEYGTAEIEMHEDALPKRARVCRGGEPQVLQGLHKVLRQSLPVVVFEAADDSSLRRTMAVLVDAGYSAFVALESATSENRLVRLMQKMFVAQAILARELLPEEHGFLSMVVALPTRQPSDAVGSGSSRA